MASGPDAAPPAASADLPRLDPMPASAEAEAIALLRIAAEVEGALVPQYLFTAGSLLPGISTQLPGFDHAIQSDDWYDVMRVLAKQEMWHLITLQNVLLSLGSTPHLDRENFPASSPLYPFPFSLQPVRLATIARYVCAEAPRNVAAADQPDLSDAQRAANVGDAQMPRAGQIYERLGYLFQDGNAPQDPWRDLQNCSCTGRIGTSIPPNSASIRTARRPRRSGAARAMTNCRTPRSMSCQYGTRRPPGWRSTPWQSRAKGRSAMAA